MKGKCQWQTAGQQKSLYYRERMGRGGKDSGDRRVEYFICEFPPKTCKYTQRCWAYPGRGSRKTLDVSPRLCPYVTSKPSQQVPSGLDPGWSEARKDRTIHQSMEKTQRSDCVAVQLTLTSYAFFCFKSKILDQKYFPFCRERGSWSA